MKELTHFKAMLVERGIELGWVEDTLNQPDRVEEETDKTRHYLRRIPEFGNRWLHVIVNSGVKPPVLVTAFFDRRLRIENENQS